MLFEFVLVFWTVIALGTMMMSARCSVVHSRLGLNHSMWFTSSLHRWIQIVNKQLSFLKNCKNPLKNVNQQCSGLRPRNLNFRKFPNIPPPKVKLCDMPESWLQLERDLLGVYLVNGQWAQVFAATWILDIWDIHSEIIGGEQYEHEWSSCQGKRKRVDNDHIYEHRVCHEIHEHVLLPISCS